MYDSSNSKKSSSSALKNISSSSTLFDQSQEGQSSSQKEEAKFVSLGKLDCPVSQTGLSIFDRIETFLAEEDDCSTSSSDDDDTDDEYNEQELLVEFKKLISKQMKLLKRHEDLLCSHKELMDSYVLLESAHEVMVTMVKDCQPHTCTCAQPSIDLSYANSCCSEAKPSCDEHVLVETCDKLIASENDELKRENEMLNMKLSQLKGKSHVQPFQDNRDHMVKKFEKGSTVTCAKLPQINLKTSYQNVDKPKIKKKAEVKCFECSTSGHFSSECPNKKPDQQSPLEDKEAYLREGALVAKKNTTILLSVEKKKLQNKSVKTGLSGLANRSIWFRQKISELQGSATKTLRWHLTST
jgi:hypothetical protein